MLDHFTPTRKNKQTKGDIFQPPPNIHMQNFIQSTCMTIFVPLMFERCQKTPLNDKKRQNKLVFSSVFISFYLLIIKKSLPFVDIVGTVLSSSGWQPLAKLSYAIFIVSCALQRHFFQSLEARTFWNTEDLVSRWNKQKIFRDFFLNKL